MIRVLIVDDSSFMRRQLKEALSQASDSSVVGTANDPYDAREQIVALKPDVITLDIEMPRMDGLTFLGKLMRYYPMPVIIVSSLTPQGSTTAVRALEAGAIDAVGKPDSEEAVQNFSRLLVQKVRLAPLSRICRPQSEIAPEILREKPGLLANSDGKLLAIGASTGGTEAIAAALRCLPADAPATVIVQHMPAFMTGAFARRLDELSLLEVREAVNGDLLRSGLALVAPGDKHLTVSWNGKNYTAWVKDGPKVFHQRPSVEVLFNSAAKYAGARAVGVLLTGMGADGAQGLLAMRQAGAWTIAQDETTSVVYGMPKAAAEIGAAQVVLPLGRIVSEAVRAFQKMRI